MVARLGRARGEFWHRFKKMRDPASGFSGQNVTFTGKPAGLSLSGWNQAGPPPPRRVFLPKSAEVQFAFRVHGELPDAPWTWQKKVAPAELVGEPHGGKVAT